MDLMGRSTTYKPYGRNGGDHFNRFLCFARFPSISPHMGFNRQFLFPIRGTNFDQLVRSLSQLQP